MKPGVNGLMVPPRQWSRTWSSDSNLAGSFPLLTLVTTKGRRADALLLVPHVASECERDDTWAEREPQTGLEMVRLVAEPVQTVLAIPGPEEPVAEAEFHVLRQRTGNAGHRLPCQHRVPSVEREMPGHVPDPERARLRLDPVAGHADPRAEVGGEALCTEAAVHIRRDAQRAEAPRPATDPLSVDEPVGELDRTPPPALDSVPDGCKPAGPALHAQIVRRIPDRQLDGDRLMA